MNKKAIRWAVWIVAAIGLGTACSLSLFSDPPADGGVDAADVDGEVPGPDADADADADADEDAAADADADGDGDADADDDSGADADADVDDDSGADGDVEDDIPEVVPVCGNTVVEGDEECDDGNFEALDGCNNECRFTCHNAAECDDGDQCTSDLCAIAGTGQLCLNSITSGATCDDSNPCSSGDTCSATGECLGVPGACSCGSSADCVAYEDGDRCNGTLWCNPGTDVCEIDPATVVTCDTSTDTTCRQTICIAATGLCVPDLADDGTVCDDGDFCSTNSTCQLGVCQRTGTETPCTGKTCSTGCIEATDSCMSAAAGTSCRLSGGDCDLAETCTGTSPDCPTDAFRPSSYQCRASGGTASCNPAEYCTGHRATCPSDISLSEGAPCVGGTGICCGRSPATCYTTRSCCGTTDDASCVCRGPSSEACSANRTELLCTGAGCYWDRTLLACRGAVVCGNFDSGSIACTAAGCRYYSRSTCTTLYSCTL